MCLGYTAWKALDFEEQIQIEETLREGRRRGSPDMKTKLNAIGVGGRKEKVMAYLDPITLSPRYQGCFLS